MKIIFNKKKLNRLIKHEKNLGFVPTMGAIHKGHASLIKKSIFHCNCTIVSIFINKPQFNKKSDYKKYPRLLKKDVDILKKLKVDFLYLPKSKEIYPKGTNKKLSINPFSKKLCGKFRPGHFNAVVDVIDRFINIIQPNKIFLGKKDFQQLLILDDYIKKNYKNIKVIGCKTIREKNGIPYSSRNLILTPNEKNQASKIYKLLNKSKNKLLKKKISIKAIKDKIYKLGFIKIDYLKIIDINKITKPFKKIKKFKIFISYYIGKTRLIDNI